MSLRFQTLPSPGFLPSVFSLPPSLDHSPATGLHVSGHLLGRHLLCPCCDHSIHSCPRLGVSGNFPETLPPSPQLPVRPGTTVTPLLPSGSTVSRESYPEYSWICSSLSRCAAHKITHMQAARDLTPHLSSLSGSCSHLLLRVPLCYPSTLQSERYCQRYNFVTSVVNFLVAPKIKPHLCNLTQTPG